MRRLELDLWRAPKGSPWMGRLLLVLAAAFAADVGFSYTDVKRAMDANRETLARAAPRAAPAARVSPEEAAAARDTVERIGMPWARLFAALEAAATEDVSLTGIEPDPKAGTVVVSGTAKDYLAALSYVLNLSRQEALGRVALARHEALSEDPQGPVSFAVSAAWTARSAP